LLDEFSDLANGFELPTHPPSGVLSKADDGFDFQIIDDLEVKWPTHRRHCISSFSDFAGPSRADKYDIAGWYVSWFESEPGEKVDDSGLHTPCAYRGISPRFIAIRAPIVRLFVEHMLDVEPNGFF